MAQYNVIIQPEAEQDLDDAFEYLEAQQKGLGFQLLAELTDILEALESSPLLFQKVYGEKRRAVVKRFKYNVIYKVINTEVYILAIIHGSRNPRKWQSR
jgi:plasmid stabilization system protein ParE